MELAVRGFGLFAYFELFARGISSFLGPFILFLPSTITAIEFVHIRDSNTGKVQSKLTLVLILLS